MPREVFMRKSARGLVTGLLLSAAFLAHGADPVAFLSDVRGDVVLDGGGRPAFLVELLPGSRLRLGADAGAAVMYVVSGEEFALKGPGEFVVAREGVTGTKGSAPVVRGTGPRVSAAVIVRASKVATASLRMRSVLAPKAEHAGAQYPVNARIATLQPTLRWTGEPETSYSVRVTSTTGKDVFRGSVKGSSLRLPRRLAAGQRYAWHYESNGTALGGSHFETLPPEAIAAAESARARAKSFSDRVLLALLLEDLDAAQDSREVWGQLAAERPDIPELAGMSR